MPNTTMGKMLAEFDAEERRVAKTLGTHTLPGIQRSRVIFAEHFKRQPAPTENVVKEIAMANVILRDKGEEPLC